MALVRAGSQRGHSQPEVNAANGSCEEEVQKVATDVTMSKPIETLAGATAHKRHSITLSATTSWVAKKKGPIAQVCGHSREANRGASTSGGAWRQLDEPLSGVAREDCYSNRREASFYHRHHSSQPTGARSMGQNNYCLGERVAFLPFQGLSPNKSSCLRVGNETNRSTCAKIEEARSASCSDLDYKFGRRQSKANGQTIEALHEESPCYDWGRRRQHAAFELPSSHRGRQLDKPVAFNKQQRLLGELGKTTATYECEPRSPNHLFGIRRSLAALTLNHSSIKITATATTTTATTSTNRWIGGEQRHKRDRVRVLSSSSSAANYAHHDLAIEQQRDLQLPRHEHCDNERFYFEQKRFFSCSSVSIPPPTRRPLWHKRLGPTPSLSTLSKPSVDPVAEAAKVHTPGQNKSESRRRKTARRRLQHKQVKRRPGSCVNSTTSKAHSTLTNQHIGGSIKRHRTNTTSSRQQVLTACVGGGNSKSDYNKANEDGDKCGSTVGEPPLPSDCFPPKTRRQQVLYTQQLKKTHDRDEIVVVAGRNSQRPRHRRRRVDVANLSYNNGGPHHHLHQRYNINNNSYQCQAPTRTTTTAAATATATYQSTHSASLPESYQRSGAPFGIDASGSSLLDVSLKSSISSSTVVAFVTTTSPTVTPKEFNNKTTTTTADDINKQRSEISLNSNELDQKRSRQIVVVRLPFELALPSKQLQQHHQQPRLTNCIHMTRTELGATTENSGHSADQVCARPTAGDTGDDNTLTTNLIERHTCAKSDRLSDLSMETIKNERKSSRTKMRFENDQQRAGYGSFANRANRSSAIANRIPLLETPPSPLTTKITRQQGQMLQSSNKRDNTYHRPSIDSNNNNNNSNYHQRTIGTYQFQAIPPLKESAYEESSPAPQPSASRRNNNQSLTRKRSTNSSGNAPQEYGANQLSNGWPSQRAQAYATSYSFSEQQAEWESQAPSTNVHSLEVIGNEARMAISIYDPLPEQQQQRQQDDNCSPVNKSPPAGVVRPNNLAIYADTKSILSPLLDRSKHRRTRGRHGRSRMTSDRVLKSPTIPEESEYEPKTNEQPEVVLDANKRDDSNDQQEIPSESFMVATIADDSGNHSRTLIIYSDRTLDDIERDVLKKLIEIELDRRHDELTNLRMPQSIYNDDKISPICESTDENIKQMSELEVEAVKLARLFKSHLEGARTPTSPCTPLSHQQSAAKPRFDPTSMNREERARFVDRPNRESGKIQCCGNSSYNGTVICGSELGCASQTTQDHDQEQAQIDSTTSEQQHRDIYDFRCSCCCLHLVDQQRHDDGEHWCCCVGAASY